MTGTGYRRLGWNRRRRDWIGIVAGIRSGVVEFFSDSRCYTGHTCGGTLMHKKCFNSLSLLTSYFSAIQILKRAQLVNNGLSVQVFLDHRIICEPEIDN